MTARRRLHVVPQPASAPAAGVRSAVRPLRIVLVAPSLDILGGQGVQAQALMECLRGAGWRVELLPVNPRFPRGLGWVRRYTYVRTLLNQMLYLPSLWRLGRADVVQIFSASYWSFLLAPVPALLVARLFGKRTLLHYHSGEAADHLAHWGLRVHPWLRRAHVIVVPSEYLREVFARHGYRVRVVPNVIDPARFHFRERLPLRPRLLCVRSFEPHYGVDVVIRAYARVRARYPGASLELAGYGSEEPHLRRLAATVAADGIRFLGRVEPQRLVAVYDRADIFLNAARVDNQPVSVLEAFAAGLPVVSTSVGDLPNMLQYGQAGRLVRAGDAEALAEAVLGLLRDPRRAARMSRRARASLAEFTWPRVREKWQALYTEDMT